MEIRTLRADEIECRVQSVRKSTNGVSAILLLYKDARVDMRIFDEVFGPFGWQREHHLINGNLFCTISVKNPETGEWVSKQDVGVESNTEKEKGQASDAFKRAGFNWGIGRELYTAPTIRVKLNENEYEMQDGKLRIKPWVTFHVAEISYNENRVIDKVLIVDNNGNKRWPVEAQKKSAPAPVSQPAPVGTTPKLTGKATPAQVRKLHAVAKTLEVDVKAEIKQRFGIDSTNDLTKEQASGLIDNLEARFKTKQAS